MKYLLLIAAIPLYGQAPFSVIEFDTYKACTDEKEDIRLWFKLEKIDASMLPHMSCVNKAGEDEKSKVKIK